MLQLSTIEKRFTSRADLIIPLSIFSKGEFIGFAFSKNISSGGILLIASGLNLSLDTQLELELHVCFNEKIKKRRISGIVKRISEDNITIEFNNLEKNTVLFIAQYIN